MENLVLAWFTLALTSCSEASVSVPEPQPDAQTQGEKPQSYAALVSKTTPYPATYEQEAERRGQIVELNYATRDYAEGTGRSRANNAFVYLPSKQPVLLFRGLSFKFRETVSRVLGHRFRPSSL